MAADIRGGNHLVILTDDDRDTRMWTHMAVAVTPEQAASINAAPDIETVNDIAKGAIAGGAAARSVTTSWDNAVPATEAMLAPAEALENIGEGHEQAPAAP